MPVTENAEFKAGLRELATYFSKRGIEIIETKRPWTDRTATYFVIGKENRRTDIAVPDSLICDFCRTREYQAAANFYATAVGGRIRCGHPEVFYCKSGVPVRITISWPIQTAAFADGQLKSWLPVTTRNLLNDTVSLCSISLPTFVYPSPTPFDQVRQIVNCVRNSVDDDTLKFYNPDSHPRETRVIELSAQTESSGLSDNEIQHFLAGKAYTLGFKASTMPREIWTNDPWDADYLSVGTKELSQAAYVLQARKMIVLDGEPGYARPSDQLITDGLKAFDSVTNHPKPQRLSLSSLPRKEKFELEVKKLLASGTETAIVVIDLDHFKAVNDTLGHAGGDQCLEKVVQAIGRALGSKGTLYRWGGDEFAVSLVDFSTDEATATAERIRRTIECAQVGGSIAVTASIGVSATDRLADASTEALFDSADKAMYKSKTSGKNRVTSWGE